ncbi:MAG: hypothetical protein IIA68_04850 [Proteobacteria bacterium]|nr:hypothetical protein [Pseudomonadota bacterium]
MIMTIQRSVIACLALAAIAVGAATLSGPAAAQSAPAGGDQQLQKLIKELRNELKRGESDRLIDPWYLRDLRKVLRRYENPWGKRLFSDDFSGRGPQPDAPWRVTAGEFLIDWRYGLRTVVEPPPARQQQQTQFSGKDQVTQLFGQLLRQTLQGQQGGQVAEQPPADPGFAAVIAPVKVTNAFAMRVELTSRMVPGSAEPRFEFGPYQGANASAGYRLAYRPGATGGTPSLELLRLSSRGGISTIELYDKPLKLEDGKAHVIEWTRNRRGRMVVRVDGNEVMNVIDRGFRDPFDGVALVNSGGDYALRSITIDGVD